MSYSVSQYSGQVSEISGRQLACTVPSKRLKKKKTPRINTSATSTYKVNSGKKKIHIYVPLLHVIHHEEDISAHLLP